jgi:ubiquinol-cytochrome c reductase cytochrome c1 subunit
MRFILGLIGAAFAAVLLISAISGVSDYFRHPPEKQAAEDFHKEPKDLHLASDGPFGKFDKRQLQRGLQVYTEVCSACHSLNFVSFHDLKGLGYNDAEIKAYAGSGKDWKTQVASINPDTGEATSRAALPSDHFPPPFPNEVAARSANNGALPPDLSLITKAREGGAAYVHSLITGYQSEPAALLKEYPEAKTPPGLYYNPYFANLNIHMPPPLTTDGQVSYEDGTKPTVDQMAKDVAAFLVWTAEPNLESRHTAGLAVTIFLLIGSILGYFAYRQIWAEAKRKVQVTGPLDPVNQARSSRAKAKQGIVG